MEIMEKEKEKLKKEEYAHKAEESVNPGLWDGFLGGFSGGVFIEPVTEKSD